MVCLVLASPPHETHESAHTCITRNTFLFVAFLCLLQCIGSQHTCMLCMAQTVHANSTSVVHTHTHTNNQAASDATPVVGSSDLKSLQAQTVVHQPSGGSSQVRITQPLIYPQMCVKTVRFCATTPCCLAHVVCKVLRPAAMPARRLWVLERAPPRNGVLGLIHTVCGLTRTPTGLSLLLKVRKKFGHHPSRPYNNR